jgi:hypothetical protein
MNRGTKKTYDIQKTKDKMADIDPTLTYQLLHEL